MSHYIKNYCKPSSVVSFLQYITSQILRKNLINSFQTPAFKFFNEVSERCMVRRRRGIDDIVALQLIDLQAAFNSDPLTFGLALTWSRVSVRILGGSCSSNSPCIFPTEYGREIIGRERLVCLSTISIISLYENTVSVSLFQNNLDITPYKPRTVRATSFENLSVGSLHGFLIIYPRSYLDCTCNISGVHWLKSSTSTAEDRHERQEFRQNGKSLSLR